MALLGTAEGNRIVLVSCGENKSKYFLKNYSVKAFDLSESLSKQRRDEEEKEFHDSGWAARYVMADELLEVVPDISRIFLDLHVRSELGVEPGDPIKVRRDIPDLFKQQLLEVGFLIAISAITLTRLFPSDLKEESYFLFLAMAGLGSVTITCIIIALRLRSRVR